MSTKTVLITGCRDGSAGSALALEFHSRGHRIFATTTDGSRMSSLEGRPSITILRLDVTSQASIDAAFSEVRDAIAAESSGKAPHLDILINNAAIFKAMPLVDVDLEDGRKIFEANFFGVLAVTQAFLPLLQSTSTGERGEGHVINVSSIAATMCPPWQGMYASSKAALLAMSHVMRVEFAPLGISVTVVMSGGVETTGIRESQQQSEKLPEGSLYSVLAQSIETNERGRSFKGTDATYYAKQVVGEILSKRTKPMIWGGAFSWVAWVLSWFGWVGMMDKGHIDGHGLNRLHDSTTRILEKEE
ncbi:hypothetical protein V2G26_005020 [Clonostachys chloroleuca]|uniref:Ketoreductase domain-containing protein n=1 Tax=Clonostachys chloroleuca TaxID=1926264 RepID=A0AA35MD21_9HYPO|nr:unnamed protein product [Clonostachys chloroleuca]